MLKCFFQYIFFKNGSVTKRKEERKKEKEKRQLIFAINESKEAGFTKFPPKIFIDRVVITALKYFGPR